MCTEAVARSDPQRNWDRGDGTGGIMTRHNRCTRVAGLTIAGVLVAAVTLLPGAAARAESKNVKEPTPEQIEFFEKKIRPVLVEKCYSCHSHQAKSLKS